VTIHIASEADLDALVRLAIAFRDHVGHMTPAAEEFCASLAVLLHDASAEFFLARTRMVKIIMRPRVRSISGAPQVVHSTECAVILASRAGSRKKQDVALTL
jgi:hypothetical protein